MTKVTHLTLDEGGGLARRRIHLREISGEADTPLDTVGQDLRSARLRRGEDLATASKALKIRKDHLEALEEDRGDALPGRTYAIGFVRSYAEYLGLDPVETVERFKSEIAGRDETPRSPVFQDPADGPGLPHGWVIIAIVVIAMLGYGAYRLALSADSLLTVPVAPVPERIAPPPIHNVPPTAHAKAPPAAVARRPSAASAPTPAEQQPAGQTPPAETPANAAPAAQPLQVPDDGRQYGLRNARARIILHALQPTHVLVRGPNGFVYINRTLERGDSYRVPDRVGLTLTTPDSGDLAVELDGQMMGLAGKANQDAEAVSLDPQAVVDRYNHKASQ